MEADRAGSWLTEYWSEDVGASRQLQALDKEFHKTIGRQKSRRASLESRLAIPCGCADSPHGNTSGSGEPTRNCSCGR